MSPRHVLLPLLLAGAACAATPPVAESAPTQANPLVRPSADGTAVLAVGQVLEIALAGNASTGYAWEFVEDGAPVVLRAPPVPRPAAAGTDTDSDGDAARRPMVGGSTVQRWHFVGAQPGEATLRMVYRRPWQQAVAPARTAVFTVVVQAADAASR